MKNAPGPNRVKGAGSRNRKQSCYISIIYVFVHTWPLCSAQILVDGVNPQEKYFQKFIDISAIAQHMSVSFVSLRSSRVHVENNTVI